MEGFCVGADHMRDMTFTNVATPVGYIGVRSGLLEPVSDDRLDDLIVTALGSLNVRSETARVTPADLLSILTELRSLRSERAKVEDAG